MPGTIWVNLWAAALCVDACCGCTASASADVPPSARARTVRVMPHSMPEKLYGVSAFAIDRRVVAQRDAAVGAEMDSIVGAEERERRGLLIVGGPGDVGVAAALGPPGLGFLARLASELERVAVALRLREGGGQERGHQESRPDGGVAEQ